MSTTNEENEGKQLSAEEKAAIEKEIAEAQEKLVSKDTQNEIAKAKEEAKKEAEKEFTTNQKIKELEEEKKKAEEERIAKEKESAEKLDALKKRLDEMATSQQPVNLDNPFNENNKGNKEVNMTDEDVKNIEVESARAFFGNDYDKMLRQ